MPREDSLELLRGLEADVESLTDALNRPNFLQALGVARAEIKHSTFLAYLLNPREQHALRDRFLREVLLQVRDRAYPEKPWLNGLYDLDLSGTEVYRERHNIDILLLNRSQKLAVIVENKTGAKEHDDQLRRYWDTVDTAYPWATNRLGIFLTIQGAKPSDDRYIALPYSAVCRAGESLLRSAGEGIPDKTMQFLGEYLSSIRREFVGDPQALKLSWKINQRHGQALKFVAESTPQHQVWTRLRNEVMNFAGAQLEKDDRNEISFSLNEWMTSTVLRDVREKSGYRTHLLFWFRFGNDEIDLFLSPDPDDREVEDRTLAMKDRLPGALGGDGVFERDGWKVVWSRRFVDYDDFRKKSRDEVMEQIERRWTAFRQASLPKLRAAIREEFFKK